MSFKNSFNYFTQGAIRGAFSGSAKWGYRRFVGYNATMKSGEGVMGSNGFQQKTQLGIHAAESKNNVGINIGGKAPGFMEWFREGGRASKFMNQIPGMNALAGVHDTMGAFYGDDFLGSVGAVIPASIGTASALYDISYYYY
jgi:hypothetical protein